MADRVGSAMRLRILLLLQWNEHIRTPGWAVSFSQSNSFHCHRGRANDRDHLFKRPHLTSLYRQTSSSPFHPAPSHHRATRPRITHVSNGPSSASASHGKSDMTLQHPVTEELPRQGLITGCNSLSAPSFPKMDDQYHPLQCVVSLYESLIAP
jgi:hypothetical protein